MGIVYTPAPRKPEPLDFHLMAIGEVRVYSSFAESRARIRANMGAAKRKYRAILRCQKFMQDGVIHYRVWRVR
jgi:hypothetical protein